MSIGPDEFISIGAVALVLVGIVVTYWKAAVFAALIAIGLSLAGCGPISPDCFTDGSVKAQCR